MQPPKQPDDTNLQTIYEELDLGDRKKDLRGKTIKIKRLVRKENGSMTLAESTLNRTDQSLDMGTSATPHNLLDVRESHPPVPASDVSAGAFRKKADNMFHSTYGQNFGSKFSLGSSTVHLRVIDPEPGAKQSLDRARETPALSSASALDFEIPLGPRKQNAMYSSMTFAKSAEGLRRTALTESNIFKLPSKVDSLLAGEADIRASVVAATAREREEALQKLDALKPAVLEQIDAAKTRIGAFYDAYVLDFERNMADMRQLCAEYKTVGWIDSAATSPSQDVRLARLAFTGPDGTVLRTEEPNARVPRDNLAKEINRRLLAFLAEIIEKRVLHAPMFAHTPSTQELLEEIRVGLAKDVARRLEAVDDLVYQTSHPDVGQIKARCVHEPWQRSRLDSDSAGPRASLTTSTIGQGRPSFAGESVATSSVDNAAKKDAAVKQPDQESAKPAPVDDKSQADAQSNAQIDPLASVVADTAKYVEQSKQPTKESVVVQDSRFGALPLDPSTFQDAESVSHPHRFLGQLDFRVEYSQVPLVDSGAPEDLKGLAPLGRRVLVFGNALCAAYNPAKKTVQRWTLPHKLITCATTIVSRRSRLNVDKMAFLARNEPPTEFFLLGAVDTNTDKSEVIVGCFAPSAIEVVKTFRLDSTDPIDHVFALQDEYSFVSVSRQGEVVLHDLSTTKPAHVLSSLKGNTVVSACMLESRDHLVVATQDNSVSVVEAVFEKSALGGHAAVAKSLQRVRIIANPCGVRQLACAGPRAFDMLDERGELANVQIRDRTQLTRETLCARPVDRFFRVHGRGGSACVVFVCADGVVGVYDCASKQHKLWEVGPALRFNFLDAPHNCVIFDEASDHVTMMVIGTRVMNVLRLTQNAAPEGEDTEKQPSTKE